MMARWRVDESGELAFTSKDIIASIAQLELHAQIRNIEQIGESGTLISEGPDSWVYFSDPDFGGEVGLSIEAEQDSSVITARLDFDVAPVVELLDLPIATMPFDAPLTLSTADILSTVADELSSVAEIHNVHSDAATINRIDDDVFQFELSEQGDDAPDKPIVDIEIVDQGSVFNHQFSLARAEENSGEPIGFAERFMVSPRYTEAKEPSDSIDVNEPAIVNTAEPESSFDLTAPPDSEFAISIPSDITSLEQVDQVSIYDLPVGAKVSAGIEVNPGEFHVSGNLDASINLSLGPDASGPQSIKFEGLSALGQPVEGAKAELTLDISSEYSAPQASISTQAIEDDAAISDWTSAEAAISAEPDVFADTPDHEHTNLDRPDPQQGGLDDLI